MKQSALGHIIRYACIWEIGVMQTPQWGDILRAAVILAAILTKDITPQKHARCPNTHSRANQKCFGSWGTTIQAYC